MTRSCSGSSHFTVWPSRQRGLRTVFMFVLFRFPQTYRHTQTNTNISVDSKSAFFLFPLNWHCGKNPNNSSAKSVSRHKTGVWHLLNQIEIKIVKYEPNLGNLRLASSLRFKLLEGYSVFHRHLWLQTHIHTLNPYALPQCASLYKLLHIAVVTSCNEKDFTEHLWRILLIPSNPW